jgi:hypothetical protein
MTVFHSFYAEHVQPERVLLGSVQRARSRTRRRHRGDNLVAAGIADRRQAIVLGANRKLAARVNYAGIYFVGR